MPFTADDRRLLHHILVKRFNRDELIIFVSIELGLNDEAISPRSSTSAIFCLELVKERERSGQEHSLVQAILAHRAENPLPRAEHQTLLSLLTRLTHEENFQKPEEPNPLQAQMEQERKAREAAEAKAAREAETRLKAEARTREEAAQRQRLAQELAQERKAREEAEACANQEAAQRQRSAQESAQERRARTIAEEQAAQAVAARLSAESQVREEVAYRQQLAKELEELRQSQPASTSPPVHRLSAWNPLDHLRLLWWLFMAPTQLAAHRQQFGEKAERGVGSWLASTLVWLPLFIPVLALGLEQLPRTEDGWTTTTYLWVSAGLGLAWLLTSVLGIIGPDDPDSTAVSVAVGVAVGVVGGVAFGVVGGVAFGVAVGVAFGVAFGVAGGVAFVVVGGVAFGVAGGVAFVVAFGVAGGVAGGVADLMGFSPDSWVTLVLAGWVVGFWLWFKGMDRLIDSLQDSLRRGQQEQPALFPVSLFVLLVAAHGFLLWFSFLGGWRLFGAG